MIPASASNALGRGHATVYSQDNGQAPRRPALEPEASQPTMSYRTNPDRILDNIDRARNRDAESARYNVDRQAFGRDLDTEIPDVDATTMERMKRIFAIIERAYTKAAQRAELGRLASRFQAVGDIAHHHARGDVSISIQYLDHERYDDVGVSPFEVKPYQVADAKKETKTSRADVNALRVLRGELREGVRTVYQKLEARIRDALRDRADMGHVQVQVTMDLRPGEMEGPPRDLEIPMGD